MTNLSLPAAALVSVNAGRIAPLGPEGIPSAFVKQPVPHARIGSLGLEGDQQADLRVHGGADKAVYAYAAAHYPEWAAEFPEIASKLVPGGFGENLTIDGLVEADLCVGDVHAIGDARLQLSEPRQPCFKLALHLGNSRVGKHMVRTDRSGWYYSVLAPGDVKPGDRLQLIERPLPDFPFQALLDFLYDDIDRAALERMANTAQVPKRLRTAAAKLLAGASR